MRGKPGVIFLGRKTDIILSFISLFRNDVEIDIDWSFGTPYEYNSIGGEGRVSFFPHLRGGCSMSIKVQEKIDDETDNTSCGLFLSK